LRLYSSHINDETNNGPIGKIETATICFGCGTGGCGNFCGGFGFCSGRKKPGFKSAPQLGDCAAPNSYTHTHACSGTDNANDSEPSRSNANGNADSTAKIHTV